MKKYIFYIIFAFILLYAGFSLYETPRPQKTIFVVSMTPDEMLSGLKNGTIAGFISWEPYPARAVSEGYGRYLVNSKDIWNNHPCCVLAISEYFEDEDLTRALVWVSVKSTRFINDPANREKVLDYGSEFTRVDMKTTSAAINNTIFIEYPDVAEVKKELEILDNAGAFEKRQGDGNPDEFLSDRILDKYYSEVKKRLDDDPGWIPTAVNGSLRYGYIDADIHNLGVYVAQKEGYFEKVGLIPGKNLKFLKFRNGLAITNAFDHREVDVAAFGMTPLLRYLINNNGKICVISGMNSGGTSLVVRDDSEIGSIDDLSGSSIATPGFGSIQDVIMRKMFEGFEIKTI